MTDSIDFNSIHDYFAGKLENHGATARGADWNSIQSQEKRFEQLIKIIDNRYSYSLIDYGSGYGSLFDYLLRLGHDVSYTGYDIVEQMVTTGNELHNEVSQCSFTNHENELAPASYVMASGIFNIKMDATNDNWTDYVIETLQKMHSLSVKGFSFNLLTQYSDPPLMRPDLYYADPCFYFDYCKKYFSKNVALLHDYGLYDFTILVRKEISN